MPGLSVSDVISVTVNLSPPGAQFANLDTALIIGDSNVIDVNSRVRSYTTLGGVAADFGTDAPEYSAAALFFSQSPQPQQLYLGRWASGATYGLLLCGALTAEQQLLPTVWNTVTNGGFKIVVNGAGAVAITDLNFSAATSLNGVAEIINAAMATADANASVTWSASQNRFVFSSETTGAASTIAYLESPSAGTDLTVPLAGTSATGAEEVNGIVAESALTAVTTIDALPAQYAYGYTFAATYALADSDHLAIAGYIQGASKPHMYGVSTADGAATNPSLTSDIGSLLMAAGYTRTFVQYSTQTLYVAASVLGRMATVNFEGANTTITLAFQQEPGVTAETMTENAAATLNAKRYNYFVNFNNGTMILMNGWCSGPAFIDEIFGLDWLANAVQTDLFNLLTTNGTKIPQTDAGNNQLANAAEGACVQGVTNGLIAPGTWNSAGFGALNPGDFMPKGFYVYPNPMATQAPSVRATRAAPALQIAVKLAGAIQSVDCTINVNR